MRGASQTSVCHTATACLYITATLTLCQLYMFTGFNSSAKDPFSILLVSDDLVRSPYCKWGNESDPGKMFAERLQKTTAHDIIKLVADLNTLECSHDMVESAKVETSLFPWWLSQTIRPAKVARVHSENCKGRGVVIPLMSEADVPSAVTSLKVLAALQKEPPLPVRIITYSPGELSPQSQARLREHYSAIDMFSISSAVNLTGAFRPTERSGSIKALALLFSGFCDALLIEPSVTLLRSPCELFDSLLPATHSSNDTPLKEAASRAVLFCQTYELNGPMKALQAIADTPNGIQDLSVLLVDVRVHGKALLAAAALTAHPLWSSTRELYGGESLSFWLAFKAAGQSYTTHNINGIAGTAQDNLVCGKPLMVIDGKPLFWTHGIPLQSGNKRGKIPEYYQWVQGSSPAIKQSGSDIWCSSEEGVHEMDKQSEAAIAVAIISTMTEQARLPDYGTPTANDRSTWYPDPVTFPSDVRILAWNFPQYHRVAENDLHWYPGMTEWDHLRTAVAKERGRRTPRSAGKMEGFKVADRFSLRRQCIMPGELGFYDLMDPNTRRRQGELANAYGVYGFIYHHYWLENRPVMDRALLASLEDGYPDVNFMLSWANEHWTRNWDGGNREIFLEQLSGNETSWRRHFEYLLPYFKHPRYMKEDGAPLFAIYDAKQLLSQPNAAAHLNLWRDLAMENGFTGLKMFQTGRGAQRNDLFQGMMEFAPHVHGWPNTYKPGYLESLPPPAEEDWHVGISPQWDTYPRHTKTHEGASYVQPTNGTWWFQNLLRSQLKRMRAVESSPNKSRYITINAWNEWGEGPVLEPSNLYGREFLQAIREALIQES